jgi:hypothetical protein
VLLIGLCSKMITALTTCTISTTNFAVDRLILITLAYYCCLYSLLYRLIALTYKTKFRYQGCHWGIQYLFVLIQNIVFNGLGIARAVSKRQVSVNNQASKWLKIVLRMRTQAIFCIFLYTNIWTATIHSVYAW